MTSTLPRPEQMAVPVAASAPAKRRRSRPRRYPAWLPYAFIGPHLVLFLAFIAYPFISGLVISMQQFDYFQDTTQWVGLANYIDLFSPDGIYGELFWRTFLNTLLFVVISTPTLIIVALALAVFLERRFAGRRVLRAIVIFPWTLSVTVISILWWNLLNQSTGLIPKLLAETGIASPAWLNSQPWAWISIVCATTWWTVGFNVLLFIAGLQNVRAELLEAATIDGANAWQRFRYVTLPALRPIILLATTLQIIASFNLVGQPQLMTGGGPEPSTTTPVLLYIYKTGFSGQFAVSPAAAMSVLVAIGILLFSVANYLLTQRREKNA